MYVPGYKWFGKPREGIKGKKGEGDRDGILASERLLDDVEAALVMTACDLTRELNEAMGDGSLWPHQQASFIQQQLVILCLFCGPLHGPPLVCENIEHTTNAVTHNYGVSIKYTSKQQMSSNYVQKRVVFPVSSPGTGSGGFVGGGVKSSVEAVCSLPVTEWPSAHVSFFACVCTKCEPLGGKFAIGLVLFASDCEEGWPGGCSRRGPLNAIFLGRVFRTLHRSPHQLARLAWMSLLV